MNKISKLFILGTMHLIAFQASAASRSTVRNGAWSDKCTWDQSCNQSIPTKNDDITIDHEVILDFHLTGGNQVKGLLIISSSGKLIDASGGSSFSMRIQNLGSLVISGNVSIEGDFELQGDATLTVTSGSSLTIAGDADWAANSNVYIETNGTVNVGGTLNISGGADSVQVDGVINVGEDFINGAGSEINGTGKIVVSGAVDNQGDVFGESGSSVNCTDCALPNGALPVELISFEAKKVGNGVSLTWATAQEINNSHFEVQRLANGDHWINISTVSGFGNSNSQKYYQFVDLYPLASTSFYRLKQVDFDGTFAYSPTLTVLGNNQEIEMQAFISGGKLKIDLGLNNTANFQVFDMAGKLIVANNINGNGLIETNIGLESGQIIIVLVSSASGTKSLNWRVKKRIDAIFNFTFSYLAESYSIHLIITRPHQIIFDESI